MPKKTIDAVEVSGLHVLIRVDFNVPLKNSPAGIQITDDRRIKAALPTIRSVIDRGGKAVLMSHLGRPKGVGYEADKSLAPVAARLSEILGKPVAFPSHDCTDQAAKDAINAMSDSDVVLLENLRFHTAEKKGDAEFATKLAEGMDVYVNDAFGTCHRPHASMVGVPNAMDGKPRVSGFLVEKEIRFLSEALASPAAPFVVILGGAKVSDKLPAIENLLPKADKILVGGAMAYTFLKALGQEVGESRVEADQVKTAKALIEAAAHHKTELHLPSDHVCSTLFAEDAGDIEVFEDSIKPGFMGLDIGPKTQAHYARLVETAKTVIWNGPMGVFEWKPFMVGTMTVAKACARCTQAGGVTIVGGGDSAAAAEQFGVADQLTHVSTGGGASLEMLEGKAFEAVDLLDNA
ncbi:MAG: phosphoglycerate kinase [Phycisphaerales bacterium]|jgi:phosphoglycerate kinase